MKRKAQHRKTEPEVILKSKSRGSNAVLMIDSATEIDGVVALTIQDKTLGRYSTIYVSAKQLIQAIEVV